MANEQDKSKSSKNNSPNSSGQRSQSENERIRARRAERRAQEEAAAAAASSKSGGKTDSSTNVSSASRTAARRQEREQEKQRQRLTNIAIIVGVIAILVVIAVISTQAPADAPIPDYTLTRYQGIPTGLTEAGYPRLGNANANVILVEYSSFDCPSCKTFHDEAMDGIIERIRDGNLALVFAPRFGTGSVVNGQGAAEAALCAGEQGAFWQMHDALFSWQGTYGNQAFTNNRINTGVRELGLNAGTFDNCVRSDRTVAILDIARQEAIEAGLPGTPSFLINGIQPKSPENLPLISATDILAAIDAAIAQFATVPTGADAQATIEAVVPESTAESTVEATASPSDNPALDALSTMIPPRTPAPETTPDAEATAEATAES